MNDKIFISTHAVFTAEGKPLHGTGSSLEAFLSRKKIAYSMLKFPIIGNFPAVTQKVFQDRVIERKIAYRQIFLPLKCTYEFLILYQIYHKTYPAIFIGINPLNAAYGILLKRLGKIKYVIFYTADYALKRFDNRVLNWFYHSIDRIAAGFADQVWNVSPRILEIREKQGVAKNRNYLVPNAPIFNSKKATTLPKNRFELVVVASSPTATNLNIIFQSIKEVKSKYKSVRLRIIGLGDWEKQLAPQLNKLGIKDHVLFHSNLPHNELLDLLSKSGIGLALYTNQSSWTYYSDSMKARDYLACGLPVIITDVIGTADDIKKNNAGYVIPSKKDSLVKVLNMLFSNKSHYMKIRNNAIKLAKENDINKILESRLGKLIK